MSSLRFLFYSCGDANKASSRVRAFWVGEELEKLGHSCEIFYGGTKRDALRFATKLSSTDIVVFQKTYSRWHVKLMQLANWFGKTTILDLDDAPSRTQNSVTVANVQRMMRGVSVVSVGSKRLLEFASEFQTRIELIPSSIKLENYPITEERDTEPPCLGWIGNGKHYQKDLVDILLPILMNEAARKPLRFKLVGACGVQSLYDAFSSIAGLQIDFIDQLDWQNPNQVRDATDDFDIGLYPLLPGSFNDFKCGFKALEYMARGIPVIASKVAMNGSIIDHGKSGFMVDTPDEWSSALHTLTANPQTRFKMGKAGRKIVERQFDVRLAAQQLVSCARPESGQQAIAQNQSTNQTG